MPTYKQWTEAERLAQAAQRASLDASAAALADSDHLNEAAEALRLVTAAAAAVRAAQRASLADSDHLSETADAAAMAVAATAVAAHDDGMSYEAIAEACSIDGWETARELVRDARRQLAVP